jgi:hypothetical protein
MRNFKRKQRLFWLEVGPGKRVAPWLETRAKNALLTIGPRECVSRINLIALTIPEMKIFFLNLIYDFRASVVVGPSDRFVPSMSLFDVT